jgi:hypothetical protein
LKRAAYPLATVNTRRAALLAAGGAEPQAVLASPFLISAEMASRFKGDGCTLTGLAREASPADLTAASLKSDAAQQLVAKRKVRRLPTKLAQRPIAAALADPSNPLSVLLLYVCANKKPVSAAKARASEPFKGETIEAPADGTTPAAAGGAVTPNFVIGTDDRKFLSPNKWVRASGRGLRGGRICSIRSAPALRHLPCW